MLNGQRPNLRRFKRLTDKSQLHPGMILIDHHACKRTVLAVTDTHVWLSHKYGKRARATGMEHCIDVFLERYPNWIFSD